MQRKFFYAFRRYGYGKIHIHPVIIYPFSAILQGYSREIYGISLPLWLYFARIPRGQPGDALTYFFIEYTMSFRGVSREIPYDRNGNTRTRIPQTFTCGGSPPHRHPSLRFFNAGIVVVFGYYETGGGFERIFDRWIYMSRGYYGLTTRKTFDKFLLTGGVEFAEHVVEQ